MKIAVLGAGSWGTTIALHLHKNGHKVTLWEFFPDYARTLQVKRENAKFLPGFKIPKDIRITSNIKEAVEEADVIVLAIPSHIMRSVTKLLKPFNLRNVLLVSVAKGIENKTFLRMSQVIAQILPSSKNNIVIFSGPSHAEEVVRNIPTTIVAASRDLKKAERTQKIFMSPSLRVYTNTDVMGVELGGSLKNIIAIACGISDGLGFGDNTKAALMTRGMHEIMRLGVAMGAKPETFAGLTGVGDLITTCISRHSRNRNYGEMLGKGLTPKQALSRMIMVVEGIRTTKSAYALAKKYKIEMPVTEQIYAVLFRGKKAKNAGMDLMTREAKPEQR
jgi:glycerol-3-phosphate dehydrogenase (NAD(P)+)